MNNEKRYARILINLRGNINAIKNFVDVSSKYNDIEVRSGRYAVDPKSLFGILSLDLDTPFSFFYPVEIEEDIKKDYGAWIV